MNEAHSLSSPALPERASPGTRMARGPLVWITGVALYSQT
jgi:hypothetical protein